MLKYYNAEVRGIPVDENGEKIDFSMLFADVLSIIKGVTYPETNKYKKDINEELNKIKVVLDFSPVPNAYANSKSLGVNLGMISLFLSIPDLSEHILNILKHGNKISIDEYSRYKIPENILSELNEILLCWKVIHESNWTKFSFPKSFLEEKNTPIYLNLLRILVGHELGHWEENIYREDEWESLMKDMEDNIYSWIEHIEAINSDYAKEVRDFLESDSDIIENWKREVFSDVRGCFFCKNALGWGFNQERQLELHLSISLYFFVLRLLEIFCDQNELELDYHTHPTGTMRESIFMYIYAKEMNIPFDSLIYSEFGFIGYILNCISSDLI